MPPSGQATRIVFVDDSSDDTPYIVNAAATRGSRSVRLLARERDSRPGGLGGAVQTGLQVARAPWICVIGGDLQDPPEAIPQLIHCAHQAGADLVVGVVLQVGALMNSVVAVSTIDFRQSSVVHCFATSLRPYLTL